MGKPIPVTEQFPNRQPSIPARPPVPFAPTPYPPSRTRSREPPPTRDICNRKPDDPTPPRSWLQVPTTAASAPAQCRREPADVRPTTPPPPTVLCFQPPSKK